MLSHYTRNILIKHILRHPKYINRPKGYEEEFKPNPDYNQHFYSKFDYINLKNNLKKKNVINIKI